MPFINILPPHVADLIAAGEVVERPASVVKELLENSVDAGAKNVTLSIERGGLTFIRVADDGSGMAPEDAGVCFLRHATSKIKDERGLEAIGTLGFRGEALAAISAVSRIELTTRERGAGSGVEMEVEAGDIQYMREAGCPDGTVMTVRDLFYNTPARLKFMKSDRSEQAQCVAVAQRCALAHPEVSFRCLRDGKEEFFTPGDGKLVSACYAVLGAEAVRGMLPCSGGGDEIEVEGFVSSPAAGRGNRAQQFFFVNGRPIRSLTLQAALENAYKNTLLTGRFPACVLHINLSYAGVDVNVHPTKAEVKFSDEKKVYDAVYYSVLSALGREEPAREAEIKSAPLPPERHVEGPHAPEKKSFRVVSAEEYGERFLSGGYAPPKTYGGAPAERVTFPLRDCAQPARSPVPQRPAPVPASAPRPARPQPQPEPEPEQLSGALAEAAAAEPWRLIGEAMNTYIVVERGGELVLIDKHAAHERMIFDRLKRNAEPPMVQSLLPPVIFRADPQTFAAVEAEPGRFEELGFDAAPFGEGEVIVRAARADIDIPEIQSTIEELARSFGSDGDDSVLHTMACKAAIKAGRSSEPEDLRAIAAAVFSGEVKYCPHGRPVAVSLTKKELDKLFKRT